MVHDITDSKKTEFQFIEYRDKAFPAMNHFRAKYIQSKETTLPLSWKESIYKYQKG